MKINFAILQYLIDQGWTLHCFKGENMMSYETADYYDMNYYQAIAAHQTWEIQEHGDILPEFKQIIADQNISNYLKNRMTIN